MNRIDSRTVELTEAEVRTADLFVDYMALGYNVPMSASLALNRGHRETGVMPSDSFIEYVSDGTCHRWGDRVLIKPQWRGPATTPPRGTP